jgi:hypothetical protein
MLVLRALLDVPIADFGLRESRPPRKPASSAAARKMRFLFVCRHPSPEKLSISGARPQHKPAREVNP